MLFISFILSIATLFSLPETVAEPANPLADFHPVWNDAKYRYCNSARNEKYLTSLEKEVIFVLNLVREYPQQFNKTVVALWPDYMDDPSLATNRYYTSLVADLGKMKPAGVLKPDSLAWISARCHAYTSGKTGYTGHIRQTAHCREYFRGECCHYGYTDPLEIVMSLLIDDGVTDLGHRIICLSNRYKAVGVSFQRHTVYGYNTVLDFTY